MRGRKFVLTRQACIWGFLALLACLPSLALADQPLLQEGKRTVFQRVVSHPGATLYADPQGQISAGKPRTFTCYYVFARQNDMLRVGVSSTQAQGWLKASEATEWPQAITLTFTKQMGRHPVLFFRDHKSLEDVCAAESIKPLVEEYVALFATKNPRLPQNSPVIACEPFGKEGEVAEKDFYLLPVLKMDAQFKEGGTQLLQVACLDPGLPAMKNTAPERAQKAGPQSDGMTTGIVFVVDTTISMKAYIEQTKEIIRRIYDKLQHSTAKEKIALAVLGFRSNTNLRKNIDYNTRIVSDFAFVHERASLEKLLDQLDECKESTHDFNEDSLAGVKDAVDTLSWNRVDAKIILLVTDAGPLTDKTSRTAEAPQAEQAADMHFPHDKRNRQELASRREDIVEGMSPEGMADYLRMHGIFLTAIHVKSPKGKKNHAYAEKSYRELSRLSNNRSSYIPIEASTDAEGAAHFKNVGDIVADSFCKIAEKQLAGGGAVKPKVHDAPRNASPEDLARHFAEVSGYAMQLRFVGDKKATRAPQVVNAWIADADLVSLEEHPQDAPVPAVEPAVLLTKMQLSELRKQLKNIILTAEEAFLQDSENFNFYEQLISAAAQMSRDPTAFNSDPKANLAQKGVLLEVLDGLPYKSRILGLQQEDWTNMSTGEKNEFIKRLKQLVREYERYDRDNTHWESFGSPNANEWVYRVPLKMLP
ncbi:MAG: VWA domain-containing protein [Desulfovibrio sp.]|nr:VWA domain-containing protein [Desulfovibrio sp.]